MDHARDKEKNGSEHLIDYTSHLQGINAYLAFAFQRNDRFGHGGRMYILVIDWSLTPGWNFLLSYLEKSNSPKARRTSRMEEIEKI